MWRNEEKRILNRYCRQTKAIFGWGSREQLPPYDSQLDMEERQMGRKLSHLSLHKMVHNRYKVSLEIAGDAIKTTK